MIETNVISGTNNLLLVFTSNTSLISLYIFLAVVFLSIDKTLFKHNLLLSYWPFLK